MKYMNTINPSYGKSTRIKTGPDLRKVKGVGNGF